MEKYQVIGLVILVVVTFFMINSDQVFAVSTYKNSTGTACIASSDFTCPLDMSNITSASKFPTRIAGVGTDNGYFAIWQQNQSATDLRLFYASTTDGITGTTPLDITGALGGCPAPCNGINEDQLHIFESAGTIDLFWLEIADTLLDQNVSEVWHARSTNGGTSFTKAPFKPDIPFFFPTVDGNTIGIVYKDANFNRMAFKVSTNGGTTFGSEVLVDGGSDECNVPRFPAKMVKDGSTIHVAWFGTFAGNTTSALCYNRSTDSGASFSTTVQILSDTIFNPNIDRKPCIESIAFPVFSQQRPCELQIFISGTKVAITYENQANDAIMQARSTNSGVSFSQATIVLDTVTAGQDEGCTDPAPVARTWGNGNRIYISCTGNSNWVIKNSTDTGLTYSPANALIGIGDVSGGRFTFADEPLGFATSNGVFASSRDSTPNQMQFVFSDNSGISYNNSTTMFMTSPSNAIPYDIPRAMTGNLTNVWLGFTHQQDTGVSNAWVSTFATGVTTPSPTGITTSDTLFGCDSPAGSGAEKIFQLNKADGTEISNQTMTLSGFTVQGCNGMAVDPTDGTFYVILQETVGGGFDRRLATIVPTTGVATDIGGMGSRFATLGFKADGTLLAVSGQGASVNPNHLFSVNKSTGATTLLCSLVAGVTIQGQTLGLNYDDGKLYHHTGSTDLTDRFATVGSQAVADCSITDLGAVSGFSFGELRAIAYNTNDGFFYGAGGSTDDFFSLTSSGVSTLITANPFGLGNERLKGLAFTLAPPVNIPPDVFITGDNPLEHLINTTYTDAGASCIDPEDGSITTVDVSTVNTALVGTYTVTYTCTDSGSLVDQEFRTVNVVEQITTTTVTGGGAIGAPVSGTVDTGIEGLTPEQQLAFDQAVADAIASIEPSEGNIIETIIQTFFEFTVVDKAHEEIQLQSFLSDQRLGFRWSTGDDLIIVSATPALSPFMFTFEQFPVVRQGSGAFVSTSFILYNLEVPRTECTVTISVNCVEKIRYEIPVTVNAIINGTQVSDTGTITVDLTEDEIDPILLIILSTLAIPFIAVIIQRSRGRSTIQPLRRVIS